MLDEKAPSLGIKAFPHIQSRIKTLKTAWKAVHDLVHGPNTSGFRWDSVTKCIVAKPAIWDAYIQYNLSKRGWRNRPFPFFDKLSIVYGKDCAVGRDAQSSVNIREKMATQVGEKDNVMPTPKPKTDAFDTLASDVPSIGTPNIQSEATSSACRKRRRSSAGDDVATTLADLTAGMRECIQEASSSISTSITTSFDMLNRDANMVGRKEKLLGELMMVPGLTEQEVIQANLVIVRDHSLLVQFPCVPDALKATWIKSIIR